MTLLELLRKDCPTVPEGYVTVEQLAEQLKKPKDWVARKLRSIPGMLHKRVWAKHQYWYPGELGSRPPSRPARSTNRSESGAIS